MSEDVRDPGGDLDHDLAGDLDTQGGRCDRLRVQVSSTMARGAIRRSHVGRSARHRANGDARWRHTRHRGALRRRAATTTTSEPAESGLRRAIRCLGRRRDSARRRASRHVVGRWSIRDAHRSPPGRLVERAVVDRAHRQADRHGVVAHHHHLGHRPGGALRPGSVRRRQRPHLRPDDPHRRRHGSSRVGSRIPAGPSSSATGSCPVGAWTGTAGCRCTGSTW